MSPLMLEDAVTAWLIATWGSAAAGLLVAEVARRCLDARAVNKMA